MERLEAQTAALIEKDKIIAEQATQLRLLPDLQRQAEVEKQQAAKERESVQLVAHERDALKRQVAALEEEKVKAAALEEKIQSLEAEQALAAVTTEKLTEVEQALADLKAKDEALRKELEKAKRPFWEKWFNS